jgi:hypothetical protein
MPLLVAKVVALPTSVLNTTAATVVDNGLILKSRDLCLGTMYKPCSGRKVIESRVRGIVVVGFILRLYNGVPPGTAAVTGDSPGSVALMETPPWVVTVPEVVDSVIDTSLGLTVMTPEHELAGPVYVNR